MKVIKKVDTSNWTYAYHCHNCDSDLEVESKDLSHYHYSGDMREGSYDKFTAICAVCSQSFTVPSDSIPKVIQIEATNRTKRATSYAGHWRD